MKYILIPFLVLFSCRTVLAQSDGNHDAMTSQFMSPPNSTMPYTWWHWMGYNISKSGITKDLEAMKKAGIGGATIFQLSGFDVDYAKGVSYYNPRWWKYVKYAAQEAKRLGLELGMHNCVGFSASGGPWITPEKSMQQVVWTEIKVKGPSIFDGIIEQPKATLGYYKDIALLIVPKDSPCINEVLDFSSKLAKDGRLQWQVPLGEYTIYRFGHTSTGKMPHPIPKDVKALEADKLSAEIMTYHIKQILLPIQKNLGSLVGQSFKHILFDSYEAGLQNWTPKMREEFKNRRGYDILPWLPTLAGATIESKELTERFKLDFSTVISDMFFDYGFSIPSREIKNAGMKVVIEPYDGPFLTNDVVTLADEPMSEFWTQSLASEKLANISAASAPIGVNLISAEAFTGYPFTSAWNETPDMLKRSGDCAFANGINRLTLHSWVLQPFPDNIIPGMSMQWWGTHFNRHQTWFELGKSWFLYLHRCQFLLQYGVLSSDFLSLENYLKDGDVVSEKTFLNQVDTENGELITKANRRYPILVLPVKSEMNIDVVKKIKNLVTNGAVVYGPMPTNSKGAQNFKEASSEVMAVGKELWGDIDGVKIKEHKYGKGKIIWGYSLPEVLKLVNVQPDVALQGDDVNSKVPFCYWCAASTLDDQTPQPKQDSISPISWIHRIKDNMDIYFFANSQKRSYSFTASLRAKGKVPEFWNPETGEVRDAPEWKPTKSGCNVKLKLSGEASVFVVLRRENTCKDFVKSITSSISESEYKLLLSKNGKWSVQSSNKGIFELQTTGGKNYIAKIEVNPIKIPITGVWNVSFNAPYLKSPICTTYNNLQSWTKSSDERIKYFSGNATYTNTFEVPVHLISKDMVANLSIERLKDLASITINGKLVRVLWHSPFVVDITKYLKSGKNEVSITVANTWANRMVGDEQYPDDCAWGSTKLYHRVDEDGKKPNVGKYLAKLPDWILKDQPRPVSQRNTFSTWNYFSKDTPLLEAGLLSPVLLVFEKISEFK